MANYATTDDYAEFDPANPTPMEEEALDAVLTVAERDIERALGVYGRDASSGAKIDASGLDSWRAEALARAVCAQAQYRMYKGDEFFASGRPTSQSSREGSIQGQEPYIGPMASSELSRAGFYRLTTGHGSRSLYSLPNQNVGQDAW